MISKRFGEWRNPDFSGNWSAGLSNGAFRVMELRKRIDRKRLNWVCVNECVSCTFCGFVVFLCINCVLCKSAFNVNVRKWLEKSSSDLHFVVHTCV